MLLTSRPESLSELVDTSQPTRDLLRVCDVPRADPLLELVEACLLTLDELPPLLASVGTEGSHEASVGVARSVELQPAGDR